MGAPIVYRSDDPGVPVLGDRQDQFYQIFRACLVDGYGTKASAGWSVVYDDWENSGWATFTNAGQSGVLGIVRAAASYQPLLFIADAMIDATTPVNARSGYVDIEVPWTPSDTNGAYHRPIAYSLNIIKWCVVATANTAFIMTGASSLFTFPSSAWSSSNGGFLAFGAFSDVRGLGSASAALVGNFLLIGGARYGSNDNNSSSTNGVSASCVTSVRDIDNSALIGAKYGTIAQFQYQQSNIPYWNIADGVVNFSVQPADIAISADSSNNWRNFLWQRAVAKMLKTSSLITSYFGWSQARILLSRLNISPLTDIVKIDGRDHFLVFYPYGGAFFLSLDAEDWT